MVEQTLLFIFNANSGKMQIKNQLFPIIDTFVKKGYRVTVYPTQKKLDAYRQAYTYANSFEVIVCSGGDGTFNEVVSGIMKAGASPMLGYIPSGTVNDFASSIQLPRNLHKAAQLIANGVPFLCDIGMFNKRYFTYIAAFGNFADVSYRTPQQNKNVLGRLAYLLEGVTRLYNLQTYHVRVEYDNIVIEDEFIFGMVTNSTSVGGFKRINDKDVRMDDGLFEVTLIKMPKNPVELQMTVVALLSQETNEKYIYFFRASSLRVFSETKIPWTLDGENGGCVRKACISSRKRALQILVDPEWKGNREESGNSESEI